MEEKLTEGGGEDKVEEHEGMEEEEMKYSGISDVVVKKDGTTEIRGVFTSKKYQEQLKNPSREDLERWEMVRQGNHEAGMKMLRDADELMRQRLDQQLRNQASNQEND